MDSDPLNPYTIILSLFLVAGLATTAWGWKILARGRRTRQWPTVEGKVVHSAVKDQDSIPDIAYAYAVSGVEYRATYQFPGGTQPSQELTATYLAKFPTGSKVTVHYDPNHPDQATLEPGVGRGDWLILMLGLFATVFGVIFLFFGGIG